MLEILEKLYSRVFYLIYNNIIEREREREKIVLLINYTRT